MSINVTVVGATGVNATIGNSDIVQVAAGGTLCYSPLTALQLTAGANITITTTGGVYAISGASAASVNGLTGTLLLTSVGVSAASAVHTHVAMDVLDLTSVANVVSVNGRTGVAVLGASDIADLTSVANVVSVNGVTGTPSIVAGSNVTVTTAAESIVIAAGGGAGGGIAMSYLFG